MSASLDELVADSTASNSAENDGNIGKIKRKKGWKKVVYKRQKIKIARVKGQEYRNYKGQMVKAKTQGTSCECKAQCLQTIPLEDRETLFKKFYNLESKNVQDAYLQDLVDFRPISRRRPRVDGDKARPKLYTYKYFVVTQKGRLIVCKDAFLKLHCISSDRVRRVTDLKLLGQLPEDRRGRRSPEKEVVVLIP